MAKKLIFLLGGARSGKSRYAEQWAKAHGGQVLYVATAAALDEDMRTRIAAHQAERPAQWHTLEAPHQTHQRIADCRFPYDTLLLDCLTLLTSNVLLQCPESMPPSEATRAILTQIDSLLQVYRRSEAAWLVVSNEVGMGVVPPSRLGRAFRDMLGRANQRIAQEADEVLLLVAGLPWRLK